MELHADEQESDESLIALTTHFAQVQFRLKQIISAEPQQKEALLKELEEFAFQGCNKAMPYDTAASGENGSTEAQRRMRAELMERLRTQLDELEQYAQEASENQPEGEGSALSSSLAEKQQIIIDGLRRRFDLHFGDLEQLSNEEIKQNVDKVVHEIIEPIRSKEELLSQLQTQVQDLERYIDFLRADPSNHVQPHHTPRTPTPTPASNPHSNPHPRDTTAVRSKRVTFAPDCKPEQGSVPPPSPASRSQLVGMGPPRPPVPSYRLSLTQLDGVRCAVDTTMFESEKSELRDSYLEEVQPPDDLRLSVLVMRKTLAVMQLLTLWQCGGSFRCLPRYVANGRKKKYQGALHSLELSVDKIAIITTALNEPGATTQTCISLETDLHEAVSMSLADSLRVLLEHGLLEGGEPVPYSGGCVQVWRGWGKRRMMDDGDCAGWRVFKHYYKIKHGVEFGNKPEQLLSSSFSLPQDSSVSMKKTLLGAIHRVEHAYSSCPHRAKDTKFRALVCEGFNLCHLAEWFRIISTHPSVAEDLYSVTSFLATTGFRPALACLERLKDNPSCQPAQLSQEYFQSTEAFR